MGKNPLEPTHPNRELTAPMSPLKADLEFSSDFDEDDLMELDTILATQATCSQLNSLPPSQGCTQTKLDSISDDEFDISCDDELIELLNATSSSLNKSKESLSFTQLSSQEDNLRNQTVPIQNTGINRPGNKPFPTLSTLAANSPSGFKLLDIKNACKKSDIGPLLPRSLPSSNHCNVHSTLKTSYNTPHVQKPKTESDLIDELSEDDDFDIPFERLSVAQRNSSGVGSRSAFPILTKPDPPPAFRNGEYPPESNERFNADTIPSSKKRVLNSPTLAAPKQNRICLNQRSKVASSQTPSFEMSANPWATSESQQATNEPVPLKRYRYTPGSFSSEFLKVRVPIFTLLFHTQDV